MSMEGNVPTPHHERTSEAHRPSVEEMSFNMQQQMNHMMKDIGDLKRENGGTFWGKRGETILVEIPHLIV